jgi:hypothetical protein
MFIRPTPREVYQNARASAPEDLDDRVLAVMREHKGKDHAISRRSLVRAVYGIEVPIDDDLSNSLDDRNIRDSIARLQECYPIIASSGTGGYWWAKSMDEIYAYAGEINSRAKKLLDKSRKLLNSAREFFEEPQQMRLL